MRRLLGLLVVATLCWDSPQSTREQRRQPGSIVVVAERPISAAPVTIHPAPPAFRAGSDGRPIVSAAGLVQAALDGPEVYDGFHLPGLIDWATKSGRLDTVNWCEIESLCAVQRVAHAWRRRHPAAPRIGIGEVTAENGGFPDLDGHGVSGHLTHQVGVNINVLYMGRGRPDKEILFGQRNEDLYDLGLQRELIILLFEAGASAVTMTAHSRILDEVEGVPDFPGAWKLERENPDGEKIWQHQGASPERNRTIILRKEPRDHGDHANVQFSYLR